MVTLVGIVGGFFFSVFIQHVTPGAFVAGLTLLTGLPDVIIALVKAALFGLAAGLIACYKGISRRRRPGRCRQRRQRDRGVLLRGAVRDQRDRHRGRREGDAMSRDQRQSRCPRPRRTARRLGRPAGTGSAADPVLRARRCGSSGTRSSTTGSRLLRLIAQMSLGSRRAGGDRRHRSSIVGFLTLSTGALIAVQGYNQSRRHRCGGADRFRLGVLQRPPHRSADRRHRHGRHHRRRRHRPAGRDAHQRGDRRPRGDGHPHRSPTWRRPG